MSDRLHRSSLNKLSLILLVTPALALGGCSSPTPTDQTAFSDTPVAWVQISGDPFQVELWLHSPPSNFGQEADQVLWFQLPQDPTDWLAWREAAPESDSYQTLTTLLYLDHLVAFSQQSAPPSAQERELWDERILNLSLTDLPWQYTPLFHGITSREVWDLYEKLEQQSYDGSAAEVMQRISWNQAEGFHLGPPTIDPSLSPSFSGGVLRGFSYPNWPSSYDAEDSESIRVLRYRLLDSNVHNQEILLWLVYNFSGSQLSTGVLAKVSLPNHL